jgi:hypothetical protein
VLDVKTCSRCGATKETSAFGKNQNLADGLSFYCRACNRENAKAHYRQRRAAQGFTVRAREEAPDGMKWCPDCGQYRSLEDFSRNAASRDGWQSYCKTHHVERGKRTYFQRKYGIDRARVEQMLDEQGGLCLICQRDLAGKGHVDHDHETGEVRGILCFPCNGGLGQFRDDKELLLRAVQYLDGTLAS